MKRSFRQILPLLFALVLLAAACSSSGDDSSGISDIFTLDQTPEAGARVVEANQKLQQIKRLFSENAGRLEELKTSMNNKDEAKVKEISNELVYQINNGSKLGEEAIALLEEAESMNVNEDYKRYLNLKLSALRKYIEAFEERRTLAKLLRDEYDPKDAAQRDRVVTEFRAREEKFKDILEEGRKLSEEANRLAKESLSKSKD